MAEPLSPHGPIKLAMSVDDLFQFRGLPYPEGYTAQRVVRSLCKAFERYNLPPVYSFSNTSPTEDDATLFDVLDIWSEAGNHVGNHAHYHASLNWVTSAQYIADIQRSETLIERWIDRAPTRYFRYCLDMWGDTPEKTNDVQAYLASAGYLPAPVSCWFYDAQFIVPYWRTLLTGDDQARHWVQDKIVEAAVAQLRSQTAIARKVHGRDPVHIGLMHGTAAMADTAERIIEAYMALGVEFVTLEEAMRDPANAIHPPITTKMFRNTTQKWAEFAGVETEGTPPRELLAEVRAVSPVEGMSEEEILGTIMFNTVQPFGAQPTFDEFDW
ncbi:peptidoglycan/xylan/chitin deacetylase (PgdA/CDA1 family) [Tamaricihabitans halophyticus]|uniref:Peptidoglycan/xylan/chitin deacetylase (PgdA/CDA1 family) n=1 Tax=Tamaricihabitans halophyticus TaxID=1262583 RepID=A0A4R2Q7D1_9PSEU|nr:polysaccharide deacetylase family protein [Tamaricihabitans halophyticus]TCP42615.1 peptidoglycan/xylan/chitin deacetylase (PgdA/CDA1 family) [Tamaricihabitans halophyticus]